MSFVGKLLLRATARPTLRRFNTASHDPAASQQRLLTEILRTNADTEFGRRHGFGGITTLRQFQERVPVCGYQDLEPYIDAAMRGKPAQLTRHPPVLFTTTSGTTGARKYIPMTQEGKRSKSHLMWLWFSGLYRDHPGIVGGRILSVVSPEVESHSPSGIPCGSESGHAYRSMPPPVRSMYTAPYDVFAIPDYEAKYYTLLRLAAGQNISCLVTVNPSTIVLLADRLARHTESIIRDVRDGSLSHDFTVPAALRQELTLRPDPDRARHLERAAKTGDGVLRPGLAWPNIAAIGCWKGGTVGSYLARFDTYFPQGPAIRDLGYYATELRGSVPLSDQGDAGAVAVATNVLEFHPADDDRVPDGRELLPVERLEVGQRYFVYVTNASGLYRYDMNDIQLGSAQLRDVRHRLERVPHHEAHRHARPRGCQVGVGSSRRRSSVTTSAPFSASRVPSRRRSTPTTRPNPPARPACTPEMASSTTTVCGGAVCSSAAALRKVSG